MGILSTGVAARALEAMVTLAMLVTMLQIPIKGLAVAGRLAFWVFVGVLVTTPLTLMEPAAHPALRASTALGALAHLVLTAHLALTATQLA